MLERMFVLRQGIDLVECARIARIVERHGEHFTHRVLAATERERAAAFRDPVQFLAGRWAAKEAIFKMLGTGWGGGVEWADVEVVNDEAGQPLVRLSGGAARRARQLGLDEIRISITHTSTHAAAVAIGYGEGDADSRSP
jgi:holo-[acyl-carrier protein] synthase